MNYAKVPTNFNSKIVISQVLIENNLDYVRIRDNIDALGYKTF